MQRVSVGGTKGGIVTKVNILAVLPWSLHCQFWQILQTGKISIRQRGAARPDPVALLNQVHFALYVVCASLN